MIRPFFSCLLILLPLVASAAPVTTYTSAFVNSNTSVNYDSNPDSVRDTSSADVSIALVSGTHNGAVGNGVGGYTIKSITDNVSASASLGSGTLKAYAAGGFGTDGQVVGTPLSSGSLMGIASATAGFADSFRTFEDNHPFLWSDGDLAKFQFTITGSSSDSGGLDASNSFLYASLSFNAYTAGTLDLLEQLNNFDWSAYPDFDSALPVWSALNTEINSRLIDRGFWYLGELQYAPFEIDPAMVVAVDADAPALLSFEFEPGDDFDWILTLDTLFQADQTLQNVSATLDFANTVTTSYIAPDGTTTYSASGLFPQTLNLADAPTGNPVPVPATLGLIVLGLGLMQLRCKR